MVVANVVVLFVCFVTLCCVAWAVVFGLKDVSRRYQTLQLTRGSPQLPMGYLSLAPLLLIPPLWRTVMDPILVEYWKQWELEDRQQAAL